MFLNLPKKPHPNPTEHSYTPIGWLGFISTYLYVLRRSHFVPTLITVLLQIYLKKKNDEYKTRTQGFPGGSVDKNQPASAEVMG